MQPDGGLIGLGTSPFTGRNLRPASTLGSGTGKASRRARVWALTHAGSPDPQIDLVCITSSCPFKTSNAVVEALGRCPLYPQKRTLVSWVVMSALCQKRTHALHK